MSFVEDPVFRKMSLVSEKRKGRIELWCDTCSPPALLSSEVKNLAQAKQEATKHMNHVGDEFRRTMGSGEQ